LLPTKLRDAAKRQDIDIGKVADSVGCSDFLKSFSDSGFCKLHIDIENSSVISAFGPDEVRQPISYAEEQVHEVPAFKAFGMTAEKQDFALPPDALDNDRLFLSREIQGLADLKP
jgi:hypothetical protein